MIRINSVLGGPSAPRWDPHITGGFLLGPAYREFSLVSPFGAIYICICICTICVYRYTHACLDMSIYRPLTEASNAHYVNLWVAHLGCLMVLWSEKDFESGDLHPYFCPIYKFHAEWLPAAVFVFCKF